MCLCISGALLTANTGVKWLRVRTVQRSDSPATCYEFERLVRRKEAGKKNRVLYDGNAPAERMDASWQCLPDKEISR